MSFIIIIRCGILLLFFAYVAHCWLKMTLVSDAVDSCSVTWREREREEKENSEHLALCFDIVIVMLISCSHILSDVAPHLSSLSSVGVSGN